MIFVAFVMKEWILELASPHYLTHLVVALDCPMTLGLARKSWFAAVLIVSKFVVSAKM